MQLTFSLLHKHYPFVCSIEIRFVTLIASLLETAVKTTSMMTVSIISFALLLFIKLLSLLSQADSRL